MPSQRKAANKICAYCGKSGVKLTSDHIPPKKLFPSPAPDNLITVPACESCNNGFSNIDQAFIAVSTLALSSVSEKGRALFDSQLRTFNHNKRLKRSILADVKCEWVRNETGIYLQRYMLPVNTFIDASYCFPMIDRITRGFHYYNHGRVLSKECAIEIGLIPILVMYELVQQDFLKQFAFHKIVGENQFIFLLKPVPGQRNTWLCLYVFYEKIFFYALFNEDGPISS